MRHTLALGVAAVLPLAACAPEIPQINYDDPAALHTEPPKPVRIVQMPELLPLPGQLKRMPRGGQPASASEPRDPARRVQLANAAASVKPTRAGYVNAIQVYPYSDGALYQLYVAPVHVTDIALEPGEELKAVAAGDTTQWKIGDTESGSGATRQAHVLVKPVSADLPMNNIVIATDRRTYHIEAHPTRETYMAAVSWRYPQDEFVALRRQNAEAETRANVTAAGGLDVSSLRFRYRISGDSPPWRPVQAFDDGHKVYIQFPPGIAQGETPPLFIIGPTGEAELVNYRVKGSTYIVDRLFAAAELRLGSNPQQTADQSNGWSMSDIGPPRKEPPPSELRIGAPPRPVTRLSRRTLVVATALVTALVFAAVWYALGIRPIRFAGGPELYNTNAKPTDALANMRDSYADLTRPRPAPSLPQPVPQLGPPLPGDLGRPMLQQQTGTPTPAADPEAERRRREREQAAASVVFFTVSARPAALAGAAQGRAAEGGTSTPSLEGTAPQTSAGDDLSIQNGQSHKDGFLNGRIEQAIYSPQRVQTPRSPYQLMAGSVIAAALITGLNSDLPGQVVAQVTEDVYDTVTGRFLLVPQGTRLIGKYDSHIAYGQERLLLIWARLVMPDGSSIVLDNLPATDTEGYAGLEDGVDYHTWRLLKGVALSSLLGISSELAANNGTQSNNRIIVGLRDSVNNTANEAGQRIVSKDLALQPTLTVRPGYPVRVLVNRDIVLRPYVNR